MPLLIIQLAILIAVIFIIGSLIGRYAKRSAGSRTEERTSIAASALAEPALKDKTAEVSSETATAPIQSVTQNELVADARASVVQPKSSTLEAERMAVATEKSAKTAASVVHAASATLAESHLRAGSNDNVGRPQGRETARRGKADDLTRIAGIGEALQDQLFALGVFHYDQIAVWTAEEAAWVGEKLSFPGRVEREEWVKHAVALSKPATKAASKPAAKAAAKTAEKPTTKTASKPIAKTVAKPETKSAPKPVKAKTEIAKPAAVKAPAVKKPAASKPVVAAPVKKRAKPTSDKA